MQKSTTITCSTALETFTPHWTVNSLYIFKGGYMNFAVSLCCGPFDELLFSFISKVDLLLVSHKYLVLLPSPHLRPSSHSNSYSSKPAAEHRRETREFPFWKYKLDSIKYTSYTACGTKTKCKDGLLIDLRSFSLLNILREWKKRAELKVIQSKISLYLLVVRPFRFWQTQINTIKISPQN